MQLFTNDAINTARSVSSKGRQFQNHKLNPYLLIAMYLFSRSITLCNKRIVARKVGHISSSFRATSDIFANIQTKVMCYLLYLNTRECSVRELSLYHSIICLAKNWCFKRKTTPALMINSISLRLLGGMLSQ